MCWVWTLVFRVSRAWAEEILETWSWLQRAQKAGSRGQSTCTSIYSYALVHTFVRTWTFCKEGGWGAEWRLHSLLIPSLLAPRLTLAFLLLYLQSCIFPKEGFDQQRNLLSLDQEGWLGPSEPILHCKAGQAELGVPLVKCCSKARNAGTALGPLASPQEQLALLTFFGSHIFWHNLASKLHFIPCPERTYPLSNFSSKLPSLTCVKLFGVFLLPYN